MSEQIRLKTAGNIENFQIVKSINNQNSADNWNVLLEVAKCEKSGYKLKLNKQEFIIFDNANIDDKGRKLYGQEKTNEENVFFAESEYDNLRLMKHSNLYFQNHDSSFSISSVPSGIKGTIYPVQKDNKPIAVFCEADSNINGQFQITLYTVDDQAINDIVALFLVNYIACSSDFWETGIVAVKKTMFYAFSGRRFLTKEHLEMLPLNRRPSRLEAVIWIIIGLLLIIGVTLIKPKSIIIVTLILLFWTVKRGGRKLL